MKQPVPWHMRVVHYLGGLKFAVIIISAFAVALAYGTFMESYHGTEYANRLIYKSPPFFALQGLMFISILFAALLRLPPKKTLYGFYTIHSGLLILFIGSLVTYIAGIDGSMSLTPNTSSRHVVLPEYEVVVEYMGQEISLDLPYRAKTTEIGFSYKDLKIVRFLPFANKSTAWPVLKNTNDVTTSAKYIISNERFAEEFILSLHPKADFQSTKQLGPLNVHYLPSAIAHCFEKAPKSRYVIWNAQRNTCTTPETSDAKVEKNEKGQFFIKMNRQGQKLTFFPDLSPLPLNQKKEVIESSPYRIFSQKLFEDKPHLFTFGPYLAFYDQMEEKWRVKSFEKDGPAIELPWMGFKVRLEKFTKSSYPVISPHYVTPINDNNEVISGNLKAVLLNVAGEDLWLTDEKALKLRVNGEEMRAVLKQKTIKLPFEISLLKFNMDKDPGTNNPASYQSTVRLFTGQENQNHRIFMNNPLKHQNFTFYQASYFELSQDQYGSVLSVNYDPGRPLKYLGSLLLVLGSIWHFRIRSKKKKKFFSRETMTSKAQDNGSTHG